MHIQQFIAHYPHVYHMANTGTWDSIRCRGLLSTTALLDAFGVTGNQRYLIESCHRPRSIVIRNTNQEEAVIRDQAPMRESALRKCLDNMEPREWYELLNRKAFFWVTQARVQTLLQARLYRHHEHIVITVDTASLLAQHADRVTVSPINSGNTLYNPPRRGHFTFQSIVDYQFDERRRKRGIANAVAELAVDYSVPDLFSHAVKVERRCADRVLETIFSRPTL